MIKIKISLIVFALLFGSFAKADEGMWLPFLLGRNYQDMKEHGLRLTEEEIYDINNSSIKDAIISFNGYCTGEVISNEGLILTNHNPEEMAKEISVFLQNERLFSQTKINTTKAKSLLNWEIEKQVLIKEYKSIIG